MLPVTDKDTAQHVLDTMRTKLLTVKMSFDQNMVNAKTCSMKLTNVLGLPMQQTSVCQTCVANWVMTPPPMGMKEDFILDTAESMEVTGGKPIFRVKPQLSNIAQPVCKHSCVIRAGGNYIHKLATTTG